MEKQKGFTLIEILIATVLLGIGIIALVRASAAFTDANREGVNISTAQFLAGQVRERLARYDFSQLSSFDGDVNSPPIGADGTAINSLSDYSQSINIEYVDSNDFTETVTYDTDFVRVKVTVSKDNEDIVESSWIRANH